MHIRKNNCTSILVCRASKKSSSEAAITSCYYFFKPPRHRRGAGLTVAAPLTNEGEAGKVRVRSCQLKTTGTDSDKLKLTEASEVVIK